MIYSANIELVRTLLSYTIIITVAFYHALLYCTEIETKHYLLNRYICKTESYLLATRSMTLFELSHCCIVSFHFHTIQTIATLASFPILYRMCYKFFVLRSFQSSWEDLVSKTLIILFKKHQNYVNFYKLTLFSFLTNVFYVHNIHHH